MLTKKLKQLVQSILGRFNKRIVYIPPEGVSGIDVCFPEDLKRVVGKKNPVCFDVGANLGQTISLFQKIFVHPRIYAFEPSTKMFSKLTEGNFGEQVSIYNQALGRGCINREFINYEDSTMSSFLDITKNRLFFAPLEVDTREEVKIDTIDQFVLQNDIKVIDLLKSDTQGFDFEVLLGAEESFKRGIIENLMIELNFIKLYEDQGAAGDIINLLAKYEIYLVDCYEKMRYNRKTMDWCTALFSKR